MQQCSREGEAYSSSVVYQTVDVSLPISLAPAVNLGDVKIMCCEEPRVECCEARCGVIELRVTQAVTYQIPIEYAAEAALGRATTECQNCNSKHTIRSVPHM